MMAGLCSVERVADVLRGRRLEMTDPEDALLDALYDEIDDALAAGDFAGVDAKITKVLVPDACIPVLDIPLASEHPNPLRRAMTTAEWLKNH